MSLHFGCIDAASSASSSDGDRCSCSHSSPSPSPSCCSHDDASFHFSPPLPLASNKSSSTATEPLLQRKELWLHPDETIQLVELHSIYAAQLHSSAGGGGGGGGKGEDKVIAGLSFYTDHERQFVVGRAPIAEAAAKAEASNTPCITPPPPPAPFGILSAPSGCHLIAMQGLMCPSDPSNDGSDSSSASQRTVAVGGFLQLQFIFGRSIAEPRPFDTELETRQIVHRRLSSYGPLQPDSAFALGCEGITHPHNQAQLIDFMTETISMAELKQS